MTKAKRKKITMTVTVSCPKNLSSAQVRREVRTLINDQAFWGHYAPDESDGFVTEDNFRAVSVTASKGRA